MGAILYTLCAYKLLWGTEGFSKGQGGVLEEGLLSSQLDVLIVYD